MNETFIIELAGRRWALPHLPFRLVMSIQPALFQIYSDATQAGAVGLDKRQIETLATSVWRALSHVEPTLDLESFLALPFSLADLFAALPSLSQAVGLRLNMATSEASPEGGTIDFDALIAEAVSATGWTWDEALDGLTVPRFLALRAEWRTRPPAHWLLAATLRYRARDEGTQERSPSVAELKAALPAEMIRKNTGSP